MLKEVKKLLQDPFYTRNAAKWKELLHKWKGGTERAYELMKDYARTRVS